MKKNPKKALEESRAGAPLRVELLSWSGGGVATAALAAKLCYSDADIATLKERIGASEQDRFLELVSSMGHHSVLEHISFTFGIEGVSRALTHQLVRHRLASYSQKSQRYVTHSNFSFITPRSVSENEAALKEFTNVIERIRDGYEALQAMGIPAEDARYLLPNACETKIIVTMNARELLHFFKLRLCLRAQEEIREMADEMYKIALSAAPPLFKKAGPACVYGACSEGKMCCGKAAEVRAKYKR